MRNRNGDLVRDPAWCQQEAPDEYDEPAEDSHLESAFEDSVNGGFDLDDGQYDFPDMDVYGGQYSEQ